MITLGVFDGVHRGHKEVINKTVSWASVKGGESIVLTFDRSPKVILGKRPSLMITTLGHRLIILERLGVNITVVLQFNDAVANMEAEDFIKEVICGWIGAKGVVLGFNCSFGKEGRGNKAMLAQFSKQYGYEVYSCKSVRYEGEIISSTLIREAVMQGDLKRAEEMQGRRVSIFGTVVSGSGRGSKIVYPTANLDLHHEVTPPRGVYGTIVWLNNKQYYAITNIGIRPTFEKKSFEKDSNLETVVEVYILDFADSIYGQDIEVQFLFKLRDERQFSGADELKKQIEQDRITFLKQVKDFDLELPLSLSKDHIGKSGLQKSLDMPDTYSYNAVEF